MAGDASQFNEVRLRLALIPELRPSHVRALIEAFQSPEGVLEASPAALREHLSSEVTAKLKAGPDKELLARTLNWLNEPGHGLLSLGDEDYPRLLQELPDAPAFLYCNGERGLLNRHCLAVVGSRNPTVQGKENAYAFSRALSDGGLVIVSGLALGIDASAHLGGMDGSSRSVAVVGTGLDLVYPARNRDLAHRLAREGILVSEFPLGTPALPGNFPRRNRIISGLSLGCLVVEAAPKSGSLITARLSGEQGREVFAIPGSIHSPLSKGCHALIKQGAKLVERAEDVLEELGNWVTASDLPPTAPAMATHALLDLIGFDPVTVDVLCERTSLRADQLLPRILELELSGTLARLPGGRIQRVR
jgi:DNA processing protein